MAEPITFITGNINKAEQLAKQLEYPIVHQRLDLVEIQSLSLEEVVNYKAKEAFKNLQSPVLVEDTALTFVALGQLPGTLIKWFAKELDNPGLCRLLDGYNNRQAIARTLFGLYDGQNLHLFDGEVKGCIANQPQGDHGFGWDPIFIPDGFSQTWGEMDIEQQLHSSMRWLAVQKLHRYLS